MAPSRLTPKQERFIEEYMVDLNATGAAVRAGYSPKTAKSIGLENLTKPAITKEITAARERLSKQTLVNTQRVLLELCCLAFYNIADMMDENDVLLPVSQMKEQTQRAITSVKQTRRVIASADGTEQVADITTEYKLGNKDAALEKLARHLGLFKEDNAQTAERIKMIFNLGGAPE